jgi:hypothetical protein
MLAAEGMGWLTVLGQGHDLEMGTNCLAPYLLTLLLEPILIRTAAASPYSKCSVRVVWVITLMQFLKPGDGISFDANGTPKVLKNAMDNYGQSKVGGAWLAAEFAKRLGSKGILSVVSFVMSENGSVLTFS